MTVEPRGDGETPASPPSPQKGSRGRLLPGGFATLRDLVSFVVGLGIILHEVFLSNEVEVYALGIGLTLMGLPLAFQVDENRKAPK